MQIVSANLQAHRRVTFLLLCGAALLAVPLAVLCSAVALVWPSAITSDAAIASHLLSLAPAASISIFLCTMDSAGEGLLIARRRLPMLFASMTAILVAMAAYFALGGGATLNGAWAGLVLFFGPRCAVSLAAIIVGLCSSRGW